MTAVEPLSHAARALTKASTPAEVKEIYDMAEAYRVYAKSADDQNKAAAFKLRAAAKGGDMLAEDPELGSGKTSRLPVLFPGLSVATAATLSSRWQRIAALDRRGALDAYLASVADADSEITMTGLFHYGDLGTLNSSESPEWYTPARYLDAVRDVLGSIDLDPASCASANEVVQASRYFTADDDALDQPWNGTVFLNPPYGKSAPKSCALFIPKLVAEYEDGRTKAAITLTSAHGTETAWFRLLWEYVVCFTDHRVPYWTDGGEEAGPTFGSAFAYLGPDTDRFAERFAEFGVIVERYKAGVR